MGKNKRKSRGRVVQVAEISCRMVGPGGTTVRMFAEGDVVKCVWSNENCPYVNDESDVDETGAAKDGHNVSYLSRDQVEGMLKALS